MSVFICVCVHAYYIIIITLANIQYYRLQGDWSIAKNFIAAVVQKNYNYTNR